MSITDSTFFKTRNTILGDMLAQLQAAVQDVYVGEDGVLRIIFEIESAQMENLSLANQILLEDMFVQSASSSALRLHGQQYGVPLSNGSVSEGLLRFVGAGGTYIPLGTEAAHDPGTGVGILFFRTVQDGTVPSPGDPSAPTVAIGVGTGLSGDYEYAVTFITPAGETLQGPDSSIISLSNQTVALTSIALGGPGTTGRRIYRQKGGTGDYHRVAEILDNTTTTYTDNMSDAVAVTKDIPTTVDTSTAISLASESLIFGSDNNLGPGTITIISAGPSGLTDVINPAAFLGGSDPEDTETFRQRILDHVQAPQTGSPADLKVWAEEIAGVDTATVFENDNLGVGTPGHVTVRISGPNGGVPDASVQQNVLDALNERGFANITFHVGTFTAVPTNVTVDVTTDSAYTLSDVTPGATQAIINYINAVPVGGTVYVSGIVDAVFGLSGIVDVIVTTPSSNQTTSATQKRTPGTITVT